MGTCETCKSWGRLHRLSPPKAAGKCNLLVCSKPQYPITIIRAVAGATIDHDRQVVHTHPDFGCIHHTPVSITVSADSKSAIS